MTNLENAIIEISSFLNRNSVPYMLIGGIANVFWGVPRATIDVDVTIKIDEPGLKPFIEKIITDFKPFPENPLKFVQETRVLPVKTNNGVRIDIIFGQLSYEDSAIKRAIPKKIGDAEVYVCSPEDLIIHKIISERHKDREDVRGIISAQRTKLDRSYLDPLIEQLARELAQPDILGFYNECFSKK